MLSNSIRDLSWDGRWSYISNSIAILPIPTWIKILKLRSFALEQENKGKSCCHFALYVPQPLQQLTFPQAYDQRGTIWSDQ